jgi:hypothetical protein
MINETIERLPSEIVQGFMNLLRHDSITCAISDCMGRFNAMTSDEIPARSPTVLRILLHSGFGPKCGAPHFGPLLLAAPIQQAP